MHVSGLHWHTQQNIKYCLVMFQYKASVSVLFRRYYTKIMKMHNKLAFYITLVPNGAC